jgi:hypothetical protein
MSRIIKKIESEKIATKGLALYTRNNVGTHIGIKLGEGKQNSIIIGITHSDSLPLNFKTMNCEFTSLQLQNNNFNTNLKLINKESKAIFSIVDNKTLQLKNQKWLYKLQYTTGLTHKNEQEMLKEKILLYNKITYLSNSYNEKDYHILYQTKTKTEAISINNKERLVGLVGLQLYNEHIDPLVTLAKNLSFNDLNIANIMKNLAERNGVNNLISIINKSC